VIVPCKYNRGRERKINANPHIKVRPLGKSTAISFLIAKKEGKMVRRRDDESRATFNWGGGPLGSPQRQRLARSAKGEEERKEKGKKIAWRREGAV